MLVSRRTVLVGLSAMGAAPCFAADWPTRPINLIHGFPPGGPVDSLSRILADALGRRLGQAVVVEAKPGATGTSAARYVARSAPDGYTLMAVPATYVATAAVFRDLPYDALADFAFISTTAEYPFVLVTHAASPLASVADIVATAEKSGSPIRYGTAGVGSLQHLTMELLARKTSAPLQHIPYRGGVPAITDLLGKRIDLVLDPPTALVPLIRDGKLRALAVTSAERFFALPDVPTMTDAGVAGLNVSGYQGLAGPPGLPAEIVAILSKALSDVLAQSDVIESLHRIGNQPKLSNPAEYKSRLARDIAMWKQVVAEAKIEPV